ncbi:MAG: 50S ribosomal protein L25/general stress protein Ctc [Actinobacteria bacterium]|nr:50S ribosomal protein L25/general stress protein Ctc [Actinomycetota bacterium]
MEFKLEAKTRTETGKSVARKIRKGGDVPGIIYGSGTESTPLTVSGVELQEILRGEAGVNALINLDIAGEDKASHLVMIKEMQKHPIKEMVLHIDFIAVARDEMVTMNIPLAVRGEEESPGLKAGGTLQHSLWDVEVSCLPQNVPNHIYADVSQKEIGDQLRVSDLEFPEGVERVTEPEDIVLSVLAPRLVSEAEEEEAIGGVAAEEVEAAEERAEESKAESEGKE